MRLFPLLLVAGLLLVSACATTYTSLEDTITASQKIDAAYNTSYRTERLNRTMVPLDEIQSMGDDLRDLRRRVTDPDGQLFIDIRLLMLDSQRLFHLAQTFGDIPFMSKGVTCGDASLIRDGNRLYMESLKQGVAATVKMDDLLYRSATAREILGTDKQKIEFYKSPFTYYSTQIIISRDLLQRRCRIDPGF